MAHKYVVDTHAVIWYMEGNPRLGGVVKNILSDPRSELVFSIIALAEAAFIIEKGKVNIPTVADLLQRLQADPRFEIHPITQHIFNESLKATIIPEIHDRLIVATALYLQTLGHTVSLITADSMITASKLVPVVW